MVVVPQDRQVTLRYTRTPIDILAAGLTGLGLIGLVALARRRPIDVPPLAPGRMSVWLDEIVTVSRSEPGPDGPEHLALPASRDDVSDDADPMWARSPDLGPPTSTEPRPTSSEER